MVGGSTLRSGAPRRPAPRAEPSPRRLAPRAEPSPRRIWNHQGVPEGQASETQGKEQAHDVLAAEAFAVPAPDPELSHGPVVLPEDPSGIEEPHDILAAEEFAMPAVKPHPAGEAGAEKRRRRRIAFGAFAALAGLLTLRRRRR